MLVCVYGAYLIVGSEFNDRVALIQKYTYWDIYMEVFSLLLSNIFVALEHST
jgi:hypothetical protein